MDPLTGKKLLILGLARQGKALARYAVSVGADVTVSDLRPKEALAEEVDTLKDIKVEFVLGEHPMTLLENTDIMAISGSVPADAALVAAARERQIEITNDSQEFFKRSPATVIGITGSAGKSTTTALTGLMGQMAGRHSWVGGNIGKPLISKLTKMTADDLVVQELSSFQLEIWAHSPPIAAVLNLTPNHLDRHKTMEAYARAKATILLYQAAEHIAVLSADDPGSQALKPIVKGRLRTFSQFKEVEDGSFVRDGQIWLRDNEGIETTVCSLDHIRLRGMHNIWNVLAACILADSAGLPIEAIQKAIGQFTGVEHRLELVETIADVDYINDSIATAPERALAALHAYDEPVILLAGGRDKEMVWEKWAEHVSQRAKAVILFGELAPFLADKLAATKISKRKVTQVSDMAKAVESAADLAQSGDVVLLSPGGTSFDTFNDFAERGRKFRQIVRDLAAQRTASSIEESN